MLYYGFTEREVLNYQNTITIPDFHIHEVALDKTIERYAIFDDGIQIFLNRALCDVIFEDDELNILAKDLYIIQSTDAHFIPLSTDLRRPIDKLEFQTALKSQTEIIDSYTLTLIENDLLK